MDDDQSPPNVIKYRETGTVPYQGLRALLGTVIRALPEIEPEQLQPASLDLRLGARAFRVSASFLPGPNSTVMDKVKQLDALPAIDLTTDGAVLERGAVYVIELCEHVRMTGDYFGVAYPKSSTGLLDVLTRLITDRGTAFDRVDKFYEGPLYIEVAPLTFSIVVRRGDRLNQLRVQRGTGAVAGSEIQRLYESGQLVKIGGKLPALRDGLVPVTVDLESSGSGSVVGYKAKKNSRKIDISKVGFYDPREFWEKIEATNGRLNLDQGDFYILATREDVGVPPNLAAEMVAYDTASGEFRVHYAGFFDPGFGWGDKGAGGSRAVLEVRSYGVSFTLEHAQIVGWLKYGQIATGKTDKRYGEGIKSNYQGQGVALAKHFKPWLS